MLYWLNLMCFVHTIGRSYTSHVDGIHYAELELVFGAFIGMGLSIYDAYLLQRCMCFSAILYALFVEEHALIHIILRTHKNCVSCVSIYVCSVYIG